MFRAFFAELESCGIDYAVLHGYSDFPEAVRTDVDFVVAHEHLRRVDRVAARVAGDRRWVVTHVRRHELTACYLVAVDPADQTQHLALDACSHFAKDGMRLIEAEHLLAGRRRTETGFFVPSPSGELAYVLAKAVVNGKPRIQVLPRLRELRAQDPAGAQEAFARLTGLPGAQLDDRLAADTVGWGDLHDRMRAAHAYGAGLWVRDAARRARRALRPSGLRLTVLGPDGAGKTTLMAGMQSALAPAFVGEPAVFKFRPDVTHRIVPGLDPTPHAREPRSRPVSVAKVLFYAADWWVGWASRLLPLQRGGSLVVFDRDFADLGVDQRRYLVRSVGPLARALRPLVPRPHATYVLDAEPEVIHRRKPELTVAELTRQRQAYRRLAGRDRRIRLVDGTQPVERVLQDVVTDVTMLLARRECARARPVLTRSVDIAVAATALVVLSPAIATLALAVRIRLGAPVLFRQQRPGLLGEPFTMYKFRTMTDARNPETGRPLPDAERRTALGSFLRRTSLDELPELLNVLRGDMSLVGPRPLLMEYLPRYSPRQMRRHQVPPGVTGLAQVNGRNDAAWPEKFALDLDYVDGRSLRLYLRVLARTLPVVLGGRGVEQPAGGAGTRFLGSGEQPGEHPSAGETAS
jgi:lipopolysaccharide/colanic/teichoic acid biosynthesis glycosyltransferase